MSMTDPLLDPQGAVPFPLVAHHLRFTVRATTPLQFGDFQGSALRGALVGVLRRTFCPVSDEAQLDPLHTALCPVCQLLHGGEDEETGGDLRRPYAIEPPLGAQTTFAPGERFAFGVALYGDSWRAFPYVALAAGGMGEFGVGQKVATAAGGRARGKFTVEQIEAINPITGASALMLAPGERLVRTQTLPVTHAEILTASARLLDELAEHHNHLTLDFLTPTRITQGEHTLKTPAFFPLIKAVARRLLDLCAQYGGGRPALTLKQDLYPAAGTVQLVHQATHWWDLKGYSARLGRPQPLGGLVGQATYTAPNWQPLLPWLLWGMSTHVGKNIVKGCGIYRLRAGRAAPINEQPQAKEQTWPSSNT
jgi:hypothetical protein